MIIGEKIKQQRKLSGLSQEKLGEQVGVSLKTIQRWENGERSPRIEEIENLASVLRTSVGYLMGSNENQPDLSQSFPINSISDKSMSNCLDLGYWGNVAENASRAARSGDIQKLTLVAALLQSALNAIMSAGASVPVRIVGMQGNIQGNNNNVKNNVAMAAAGAPA